MLYRQWRLKSDSVFWVKDETLRVFPDGRNVEEDSKRLSAAVGRGLF